MRMKKHRLLFCGTTAGSRHSWQCWCSSTAHARGAVLSANGWQSVAHSLPSVISGQWPANSDRMKPSPRKGLEHAPASITASSSSARVEELPTRFTDPAAKESPGPFPGGFLKAKRGCGACSLHTPSTCLLPCSAGCYRSPLARFQGACLLACGACLVHHVPVRHVLVLCAGRCAYCVSSCLARARLSAMVGTRPAASASVTTRITKSLTGVATSNSRPLAAT